MPVGGFAPFADGCGDNTGGIRMTVAEFTSRAIRASMRRHGYHHTNARVMVAELYMMLWMQRSK